MRLGALKGTALDGPRAPVFTLADQDGQQVSLEQFLKKLLAEG
ncbi:MAG TPA: hypothetical protein VMW62_07820 [Chloroflexota bacterium]|nr:hypothetical protein [Chloroflexota bacterium]